jgi:3-isopropylmalate/(R)-2-methylmalate dehydratase small subunit
LIPVQVDQDVADLLLTAAAEEPGLQMVIDVENRTLSVPEIGVEVSFPMDDFTQHRLLNGLDDIGLTLQHQRDVDTFEARRPGYLPVTLGGAR